MSSSRLYIMQDFTYIFEDNDYKVGINEPYSNSETPDCPFP